MIGGKSLRKCLPAPLELVGSVVIAVTAGCSFLLSCRQEGVDGCFYRRPFITRVPQSYLFVNCDLTRMVHHQRMLLFLHIIVTSIAYMVKMCSIFCWASSVYLIMLYMRQYMNSSGRTQPLILPSGQALALCTRTRASRWATNLFSKKINGGLNKAKFFCSGRSYLSAIRVVCRHCMHFAGKQTSLTSFCIYVYRRSFSARSLHFFWMRPGSHRVWLCAGLHHPVYV